MMNEGMLNKTTVIDEILEQFYLIRGIAPRIYGDFLASNNVFVLSR